MLSSQLSDNLHRFAELTPLLQERTGFDDVALLRQHRFEMFFKLGVPKVLSSILKEEDWFVDSHQGIRTYEFERSWKGGSYTMLHFVIDVRRQDPPREQRAPGILSTPEAESAYEQVVQRLFSEPEEIVTLDNIDQATLHRSLELIKARRRKYCPDCPEEPPEAIE
jgi:hypothetical protein